MASIRIFRLESEGGPYDLYEEPWTPGSCIECVRFEKSETSTPEATRICPYCKRHWYKYDAEKKLWRQVTDPAEWADIVKQLPIPESEKKYLLE